MISRTNNTKPSIRYVNWNYLTSLADRDIAGRGRIYYYQERAKIVEVDEDRAKLLVRGSRPNPYTVEAYLDDKDSDKYVHVDCNCPYAEGKPLVVCKHKYAAFLELEQYFRTHPRQTWDYLLDEALGAANAAKVQKNILVFRMDTQASYRIITPMLGAAGKVPKDLLDDPDRLASFLLNDKSGPKFKEIQGRLKMERVVNATTEHIAAANLLQQDAYSYYGSETNLDLALNLLDGALIFEGSYRDLEKHVQLIAGESKKLEVTVSENDGGIVLSGSVELDGKKIAVKPKSMKLLSQSLNWVLAGSKLFRVDAPLQMLNLFMRKPEIKIPKDEAEAFYQHYLPSVIQKVAVSGDGIGEFREVSADPVPRVYLKEVGGDLEVELRFGYDTYELPFDADVPDQTVVRDAEIPALVRVNRDSETEQKLWKAMSSYGLKRKPTDSSYVLRQRVGPVDFLIHHVPKITAAGYEVYGEENLKSVKVNRSKPKISLWVSSDIDWFDLKVGVEFGDTQVPFAEVRKAIKSKERFIKLADGSIGEIPEEWINRYKHLFNLAEASDDGLRLNKTQAILLEQALEEADDTSTDAEFQDRLAKLRDFKSITKQKLPKGFRGELRHYQKAGYDWLHFLHEYGFGGCLADDMGIGKTVQALVFLQSLRERGHATSASLIVMPRSLLTNWIREAERFVPDMRILYYADLDRPKDIKEFDGYDLVITTYGVMRRDLDVLKSYSFHYVVLDESQSIKNPLALTARAARALNAEHRLVLTGTPVENSTLELWSQFAFLNPGMLGSMDYFKEEFAGAIERGQDDTSANRLRSMVHPFILRRTKKQVAPELPPLEERVVFCDLEAAQRKLYDRTREEYRTMLLGMIEGEGVNAARMRILEGLLRLRQICNHPKLVDKDSHVHSAKFEVLLDMLETLQAEGHKALVFSQFTKMLKILRAEMDLRGITYQYLDGSTMDRQERVDEFQSNPDVPFFLISLKAGGVGLNLTAADYVIHIDPWWNPAVERQASDRTHRIGQENPVFVNKLIARDTVEEKMLELQERKKNLVEQLISTERSFFKSLTGEDVKELFS